MCSYKVPNKYYVFNVKYHYVALYLMLPVDVIIVVNGKIFIFLCVLYAMLNKKDAIWVRKKSDSLRSLHVSNHCDYKTHNEVYHFSYYTDNSTLGSIKSLLRYY